MVDDGSNGTFGKEIEFRAKLENELRKDISAIYYEKKRKVENQKKLNRQSSVRGENVIENTNEEKIIDYNFKEGIKKGNVPMVLIVGK